MGFFSHIVVLAIGFYGGSHMAKNYELNRMRDDFMKSEVRRKVEELLKEYKKDFKPCNNGCGSHAQNQ